MPQSKGNLNNFEGIGAVVPNNPLILKSCKICKRTFNPQSLERHEKVCEKTTKLCRRTVFNSFLQRAKETNGIPIVNEKKTIERERCKGTGKEDHGSTRMVRGDRTSVLNNGLSLQKKIPPGHQQCPSCNRCFNEKAADRHIVWCQEQQTRMPKTPPSVEALERLKARTKYRAPLPGKKNQKLLNQRLVKSAESVRESSSLRTHSSPPISTHQPSVLKQSKSEEKIMMQSRLKKSEKCSSSPVINKNENVASPMHESKEKKSVKFKEKFPTYDKERNKNLDMLAALRLRLSVLNTSDDFETPISRCDENQNLSTSTPKNFNFPTPLHIAKDSWSSDGEIQCSTSSSSDGSLPSVSPAGVPEHRLPRFCYNCGTKYPIVSAKYCCECGARRFIFGPNDNQLFVM